PLRGDASRCSRSTAAISRSSARSASIRPAACAADAPTDRGRGARARASRTRNSRMKSAAADAPPLPDLLGLSRAELAQALQPLADRPFRAVQIYEALHARGIADFASMTDLTKDLRAALAERFR